MWSRAPAGLARHDLGDEVTNGRGGLVRVELRKEVTGIVNMAALFPSHKTKDSEI